MTYLTRLAAWVELNRDVLEQHGQVSFSYGPAGTNNPSAHLSVALSTDEGAELLVWESGDAEFNHGSFAASVLEHVDLDSPDDLAALLGRFLDVVTGVDGTQPLLQNFRAVLGRLASSAQEQAKYLTELGVADSLDELALEFDDLYGSVKAELGSLPNGPELTVACQAVNAALLSEDLGWSFDDLNSAAWGNIRHLAGRAHELVGSIVGSEGARE